MGWKQGTKSFRGAAAEQGSGRNQRRLKRSECPRCTRMHRHAAGWDTEPHICFQRVSWPAALDCGHSCCCKRRRTQARWNPGPMEPRSGGTEARQHWSVGLLCNEHASNKVEPSSICDHWNKRGVKKKAKRRQRFLDLTDRGTPLLHKPFPLPRAVATPSNLRLSPRMKTTTKEKKRQQCQI